MIKLTKEAEIIKENITPEEFCMVVRIEEHTPEGIFITQIR